MQTTKEKLNSVALAVLIAIPICFAKVSVSQRGHEVGVRAISEQEADLLIKANTSTEAVGPVVEVIGPIFVGYDFIPLNADFQYQIYSLCKEYKVEYDLILAVIKTETEFEWLSGDNGQATGYMQIWSSWWQETANAAGLNINDPLDNIHMGIIILSDAIDENGGNITSALKQYNSGNPDYVGNEYINKVYENIRWISDMKAGE